MFLVTETKGAPRVSFLPRELEVVPRTWVRRTKNRRCILLWPSETKVEVLKQMSRDATSQPQAHWVRIECKVLHMCETFSDAESALAQMSGQSFIEETEITTNTNNEEISVKCENLDAIFVDVNIPPPSPQQALHSSHYSVPSTNGPLLPSASETVGPTISDLFQLLTQINQQMQVQNRISAEIKQQQQQQFHILQQRQDKIEKSLTEVIKQQKLVLQEMKRGDLMPVEPSFSFQPMECVIQLKELEMRLTDEAYRQQMEEWIKWSVIGKTSSKRMLCCFDLLFSRKLQAQCTWTGVSRGGQVKTGIMQQRNVISLFKTAGTTQLEKVNNKKIAEFFMQRLKNIKRHLQPKNKQAASGTVLTSSEDRITGP